MGKDIVEITSLFVAAAFAALLIGHAQGTATVVRSISEGFGSLLSTVELAGGSAGYSGIPNGYAFGGFGG